MIQSGFLDRELDGRRYVAYVPRYEVKPPYPTILYLHGMGESGTDGFLQISNGLPLAITKNRARWPFLILIPQKPDPNKLWPAEKEFLEHLLISAGHEFDIDPHRRYLTGLSQGGNGTFMLAKHLPWQFAAIAPVCGWMPPELAAKELHDIPVKAFHGGKDQAVDPKGTIDAIAAIKAAGGNAEAVIYPEANHNSWDKAYQESDLPSWLLGHTLA